MKFIFFKNFYYLLYWLQRIQDKITVTNPACLNEILLFLWVATKDISLQLKIARRFILSVISVHLYFVLIRSAIKSSTLGLYALLLLTMETVVNSICEGCWSQCNTSTKHIATPDWWRGDAGLLSVTSNLWREGVRKRTQVISILYRDGRPTANRSKWISINRLSEKRGVLDLSCNDILVLGEGQQLFLSKCWLCHALEHIYTVQNVT